MLGSRPYNYQLTFRKVNTNVSRYVWLYLSLNVLNIVPLVSL